MLIDYENELHFTFNLQIKHSNKYTHITETIDS